MSTENMGIDKGMAVYGIDGKDLGTISHVWTAIEETPTTFHNYFKVDEGGFLGIGERVLYIPFEAVETVVSGESVAVNCSREQCIDLYSTKPEAIKKKEAAIAEGAVIAATTPVIFH